jgi:hypothetical protein
MLSVSVGSKAVAGGRCWVAGNFFVGIAVGGRLSKGDCGWFPGTLTVRIVDAVAGVRSWRAVDGVVILGETHRIASPGERAGVSLDERDVIVIQTKATRLNPYVFGQALLGMDLIRMRWAPHSLRSVLICAADDPELRPVIGEFPDVEVQVARSERRTSFGLQRLPGAVIAGQRLLLRMGAAAVHSIVLCRRDQAIEAALRRYASFEIVEAAEASRIRQAARLS